MTTLAMQVVIENGSTLPQDAVVNVWHFQSLSLDPLDDFATAAGNLAAFYNAIDGLMSGRLSGNVVIKGYNLVENPPRAPIDTYPFTITPGTGDGLPNEVAIVLSYAAATISGIPRGRRRGRIYLGPWDTAVLDQGTGDSIVDAGAVGAIATAGDTLLNANTSVCKWSTFSPTIAGAPPWSLGELTASTFEVDHGYVDNAFDTMRSRGQPATMRSTF